MRHPLSTSCRGIGSKGPVAVGCLDSPVVADAFDQAVPQDFEPAVAGPAPRRVVVVSDGDHLVVELFSPGGPGQATEGPLLDGFAEMAVAGQAAGESGLAAPGPPSDRNAFRRVHRGELLVVLADPVRHWLAQVRAGVRGHQGADPGVLGIVFLLRRAAAASLKSAQSVPREFR